MSEFPGFDAQSFDEVMKEDEDYCVWAMTLRGLQNAMKHMETNEEVEPPNKKHKVDDTDNMCKTCFPTTAGALP